MSGETEIRALTTGAPLARAKGAVILLNGRGGSAEGMLSLAGALGEPALAYVAPRRRAIPGIRYRS